MLSKFSDQPTLAQTPLPHMRAERFRVMDRMKLQRHNAHPSGQQSNDRPRILFRIDPVLPAQLCHQARGLLLLFMLVAARVRQPTTRNGTELRRALSPICSMHTLAGKCHRTGKGCQQQRHDER